MPRPYIHDGLSLLDSEDRPAGIIPSGHIARTLRDARRRLERLNGRPGMNVVEVYGWGCCAPTRGRRSRLARTCRDDQLLGCHCAGVYDQSVAVWWTMEHKQTFEDDGRDLQPGHVTLQLGVSAHHRGRGHSLLPGLTFGQSLIVLSVTLSPHRCHRRRDG